MSDSAKDNPATNSPATNSPVTGAVPTVDTDIEQQRAELAATVGELADRLDVPTRVKHAADERLDQVRDRPDLIAAAAGALVAVLALVVWRRRRRSKNELVVLRAPVYV
ncbi:DUF3618 domain-containing protein [Rhodococcus chondri]|uniref:DUF3618 domain-containing protein n=1 Tax=Rhodococcus chondri TaxID=3065941 RepID=A0ABU7JT81_9NOCA|nr:DUF3618 domain-containing protein [Rhodococcus sp. CC-R104]MEE2033229.1 DUF3618 domain-containing protein [Rhodococcus sp. CC-R104]